MLWITSVQMTASMPPMTVYRATKRPVAIITGTISQPVRTTIRLEIRHRTIPNQHRRMIMKLNVPYNRMMTPYLAPRYS